MVDPDVAGANITQDTARLAITEANPTFVLESLRSTSLQRWMAVFTKGAAVRGINLGDVKKIPIPLPPRREQDRFAEITEAVRSSRSAGEQSVEHLNDLFSSVQQRAFRGEL